MTDRYLTLARDVIAISYATRMRCHTILPPRSSAVHIPRTPPPPAPPTQYQTRSTVATVAPPRRQAVRHG